jgi:hypothetical protein
LKHFPFFKKIKIGKEKSNTATYIISQQINDGGEKYDFKRRLQLFNKYCSKKRGENNGGYY